MTQDIKYIELKSGFGDSGPAWISKITYSKSGQTVYFNDMALKKLKVPGISGNHYDIENGDEYWISGIKKNGQDRHWAGGGKIMIDEEIIDEYLSIVDFTIIENKDFDLVSINKDFDKSRFSKIENEAGEISKRNDQEYYKWYWDNNRRKLIRE
jgi:hypothetical protein